MEKPEQNQSGNMNCGVDHGSLPGCCASLAFPFVPVQEPNPVRYSRMEALQTGTLFPGLDLPFKEAIQAKTKMANTLPQNLQEQFTLIFVMLKTVCVLIGRKTMKKDCLAIRL